MKACFLVAATLARAARATARSGSATRHGYHALTATGLVDAVVSVWLLIHDDRHYDMGDMAVRGAYATAEAATSAIVTRTPSGQRSRAWAAHDENCCSVEEFEIEHEPQIDTKEDDPPMTGPGLIPQGVADRIHEVWMAPSFLDRLRRG